MLYYYPYQVCELPVVDSVMVPAVNYRSTAPFDHSLLNDLPLVSHSFNQPASPPPLMPLNLSRTYFHERSDEDEDADVGECPVDELQRRPSSSFI